MARLRDRLRAVVEHEASAELEGGRGSKGIEKGK
jgi:hypothetical protein